jgi:regulator of sirC expression with transglutaminase-like and TPR domain
VGQAWECLRQGQRERARQLAHKALGEARGTLRGEVALVLWACGDRDEALAQARRALEEEASDPFAHTVLGLFHAQALHHDQALAHLWAAYRRLPTVRRAENLARTLREAGKLPEALSLAREAQERLGPHGALLREEALAAEALGDVAGAQALWDRLRQDPREGEFARARWARLAAREEMPHGAAQALRQAAQARQAVDPAGGAALRLAAADEARAAHRWEEAVEGYRAYLEARPGNPYALRQLAFALRHLGRGAEARPLLESLLEQDPSDAYVRQALTRDYAQEDPQGGLAFFRRLAAQYPQVKELWGSVHRLRRAAQKAREPQDAPPPRPQRPLPRRR